MRAHVYMLLFCSIVRAQVNMQRAQVYMQRTQGYDAHNSNLHAQSSMQVDILMYSIALLYHKADSHGYLNIHKFCMFKSMFSIQNR